MRLGWAKLLKYVFELDLEHCSNCGGELEILEGILEQPVTEEILTHLGLPARAPSSPGPAPGARRCKRPDRSQPPSIQRTSTKVRRDSCVRGERGQSDPNIGAHR